MKLWLEQASLPPGPPASENDAFVKEMRTNPISALSKLYNRYGKISRFSASGRDVYFLNHPDYIKQVSVIDHHRYVKNKGSGIQSSSRIYESLGVKGNRIFEELIGNGILMSEGELHDWHRKVMQPAFSRASISSYAPYMTNLIAGWCNQRREDEIISVRKEMEALTLAVVLHALFSVEVTAFREFAQALSEFGKAGEAAHRSLRFLEGSDERGLIRPGANVIKKLPLPARRRYEKATQNLDNLVYAMIQKRREKGSLRQDVLSLLLQGHGDAVAGRALSDAEIRDEVLTIILAGHDTVANALTWTFYLLSRHEDVYSRLKAELKAVLGGRTPGYEDVGRMPYTMAVFNEALRLYPPVWLERRRAVEDIRVEGYTIPVGSVVLISQYIMHHDSTYYSSPEEFDPDRWSPEKRDAVPTFAYFPFGVGPRACIGEPFAKLEAPLVMAMISQKWRMKFVSKELPEVDPHVTLQPKSPILMKLTSNVD
jgi:cytochrome P450